MAIQKISSTVIGSGAVTSEQIATGAITAADIPDGEITTAKLADDAVTNAKIAANAVTSTEIANGSVTYNQIADGTIITSKLADSQITTSKIADGNITSAKMANDITIGGNMQAADYILEGISTNLANTAVDIFIYDTSKDSDGGEWRNKTQDTSWYNETLNTATRGSRKEFPAVAVIVVEDARFTIYDGDDPALPMWMTYTGRFSYFSTNYITSVVAKNGWIFISNNQPDNNHGLTVFSFPNDIYTITDYASSPNFLSEAPVTSRGVQLTRHSDASHVLLQGTPVSINKPPNDLSITVTPNAMLDPATGLPLPTIAIATNSGVSVIRDNGNVYSINHTDPTYNHWSSVNFTEDNKLIIDSNYNDVSNNIIHVVDIPSSNVTTNVVNARISALNSRYYHSDSSIPNISLGGSFYPSIAPMSSQRFAIGSDNTSYGLNLIDEAPETVSGISSNAMVAYITSSYNTGWQVGSSRLASLSETTTGNLVGGTVPDRSVKNNPLQVSGTISRTPVATGAELVGYSGFSETNFLKQSYSSNLDFGTGDFSYMAWFKFNDINTTYGLFSRQTVNQSDGNRWQIQTNPESGGSLAVYNNGNIGNTGFSLAQGIGNWILFAIFRKNSSIYASVNGETPVYLGGDTANYNNGTADFIVAGLNLSSANSIGYPLNGSVSLVRVSATAPSAEQLKKIFDEEKVLFRSNAVGTLYGISDAVTALSYDSDTELLHAGTPQGRSVFQGLRRIDNTIDAVSTAISANNGMVAEQ